MPQSVAFWPAGREAFAGSLAVLPSHLITSRLMPVPTCVVFEAVLLVSSVSGIVLFGSTVAVLVIGPVVCGAITLMVIVAVLFAGIEPLLHVTTFEALVQVKPLVPV